MNSRLGLIITQAPATTANRTNDRWHQIFFL